MTAPSASESSKPTTAERALENLRPFVGNASAGAESREMPDISPGTEHGSPGRRTWVQSCS